ncbi:unnamed protein product [Haemonchus placei]|uniref:NR LBD domain-containing protein n=1 Tax=Haemonchus placei TaxID=6290 RepID=A0A0N4X7Z1_HAEPC|nr:unnamed protein product [Haemonchus placei]
MVWNLQTLPLKLETPVPSDIAISRSQTPKNIEQVRNLLYCYSKENKNGLKASVLNSLPFLPVSACHTLFPYGYKMFIAILLIDCYGGNTER